MFTRRSISGLAAAFLATTALAGCNPATVQTVVSDAQLIASRLGDFVLVLQALPGVPAADTALFATLVSDISQAATLASTVYTTLAPVAANTLVQNIEKAVTGALQLATTPPLSVFIGTAAPQLTLALQFASVLVPGLFTVFGLPAPVGATPGISPEAARAGLQAMAI